MTDYSTGISQAAQTSGNLAARDLERIQQGQLESQRLGQNQQYMQGQLSYLNRNLDIQEKQRQQEQWLGAYKNLADQVTQSAAVLKQNGKTPQEIAAALSPPLTMLRSMEQRFGQVGITAIQPGTADAIVHSALAQPTAVETATTAGQAKGAAVGATYNALPSTLPESVKQATSTGVAAAGVPYDATPTGTINKVTGEQTVDPAITAATAEIAKAKRMTINTGQGINNDAFAAVNKQQTSLQDASAKARQHVEKIQQLNELLGDQGGTLAPFLTKVRGTLESLGFDVKTIKGDLGSLQAGNAYGKLLALEVRNPGEGAGLPGNFSDADRNFVVDASPTLAMTPAGRKLLELIAQKSAERSTVMAKAGQAALDQLIEMGNNGEAIKTQVYMNALDAARNSVDVLVKDPTAQALKSQAQAEYVKYASEIGTGKSTESTGPFSPEAQKFLDENMPK